MYLALVLWVSSLAVEAVKHEKLNRTNVRACTTDGYQMIAAKFGKETHLLCLQLRPLESPLANRQAMLLFEPEESFGGAARYELPIDDITMAYGFPISNPSNGAAEGYIGDDAQFYGVLHMGNRTLHADPYGIDDPNKFFGAFENDNMAAPRQRREHAQRVHPSKYSRSVGYFPYLIEDVQRVSGVARARICDLLLLADKEFFEKDANSSLNHVVRRMMHAIAQADIIFRNADFNEDGVPDNIGFSVKYILVLTSTETNTRVFGDLLNTKAINGRNYLMRFARLRRLSEVCLGVAFSGHAFHNRTLGLSFTSLGGGMGGAAGGLCDRRAYGRSFNTLAIAHATTEDDARVPERIAALTLAHEMGHSFGAHHDDNFPNPECRGYLMGSQSSTAESGMNFEFSICSKRLIAATLSSMSYCLMDEDKPYCGNGIVEDGEACDCGLPSRCVHKDPCCTPRGGGAQIYKEGTLHKQGCEVAPSAVCHPSQGLCCTSHCRLADLTKSGIDCSMLDKECTCDSQLTNMAECKCGLGGRCMDDNSCQAAECVRLGLKECQCTKHSKEAGGLFTASNTCGICCLIADKGLERCVGADIAARDYMMRLKRKLPIHWPDPDYHGPNVSIILCEPGGLTCTHTFLRAWTPGSVCLSRNMVGICSMRGICVLEYNSPRSNVYPDIMVLKDKRRKALKKLSTCLKPVSTIFVSVFLLYCLIK